MKKLKVYIASPYTDGDTALNVKMQMDFADKLMDEGFTPFVPLLSHFQHMAHPRQYDDWLMYAIDWLKSCDVLLRVGGESPGAEKEIEIAKQNKIPVFYGITPLLQHYKKDFKNYTS